MGFGTGEGRMKEGLCGVCGAFGSNARYQHLWACASPSNMICSEDEQIPAVFLLRYLLPLSRKSSLSCCRGRWHMQVKSRLGAKSNGSGEQQQGICKRVVTATTSRSQTSLQSGHRPSPPGPSLSSSSSKSGPVHSYKNQSPLLGAVSSAYPCWQVSCEETSVPYWGEWQIL